MPFASKTYTQKHFHGNYFPIAASEIIKNTVTERLILQNISCVCNFQRRFWVVENLMAKLDAAVSYMGYSANLHQKPYKAWDFSMCALETLGKLGFSACPHMAFQLACTRNARKHGSYRIEDSMTVGGRWTAWNSPQKHWTFFEKRTQRKTLDSNIQCMAHAQRQTLDNSTSRHVMCTVIGCFELVVAVVCVYFHHSYRNTDFSKDFCKNVDAKSNSKRICSSFNCSTSNGRQLGNLLLLPLIDRSHILEVGCTRRGSYSAKECVSAF